MGRKREKERKKECVRERKKERKKEREREREREKVMGGVGKIEGKEDIEMVSDFFIYKNEYRTRQ